MSFYNLSPIEEIAVLLFRVEDERHKVLFVKGEPYHDKAVRKIKRMHKRIIKLGGNPNLTIDIKEQTI